ncbi:MAG: cytochrome c3 family protein [Magnetococcus sp. DMHC-6]
MKRLGFIQIILNNRLPLWLKFGVLLGIGSGIYSVQADDFPTNFTNRDGISNTRHNLSLSSNVNQNAMITVRNQYGEVCVYCHTPHGANENIDAPLWNRTFKNNTYQTYDQVGSSTLTAAVNQPGVGSLTCLSCHDGTVAIDSIVNMPGSGRYSEGSKTSHQESFLDSWVNTATTTKAPKHAAMGTSSPDTSAMGCMSCHNGDLANDFTVFYIGTDLRNDHPIGVDLPTNRIGIDFANPTVTQTTMAFYDQNGNNKADSNEVRFLKTGSSYRVECASCHDPHGVAPSHGAQINPSFLRVNNQNSTLCLTCHTL